MSNLRRVGSEAEDRAADYLVGEGYTIVTRRYKARHGELDLIALEGDVLVFVEVKYRQAPGYLPEEAVGRQKLQALGRAIDEYLAAMELTNTHIRLDLIALDGDGLRHHKDLFAQ